MDKIETNTAIETGGNQLYNFDKLREITPDKLPNKVLARLIEEVRNDEQVLSNNSYNRFHNRHNR